MLKNTHKENDDANNKFDSNIILFIEIYSKCKMIINLTQNTTQNAAILMCTFRQRKIYF